MKKKDIKNLSEAWIAKKSKMPICGGKLPPAIFVHSTKFKDHLTLFNSRSHGNIRIQISHLDHFEIISDEIASNLVRLFEESSLLSPELGSKTHFREDGVTEKVKFEPEKFQMALYRLKIQFPEFHCEAYECPTCGSIHLGKRPIES
jgi:hypothetical protein